MYDDESRRAITDMYEYFISSIAHYIYLAPRHFLISFSASPPAHPWKNSQNGYHFHRSFGEDPTRRTIGSTFALINADHCSHIPRNVRLQTGISGDAIPSTTNQIPQSGAQGETPNPPKPFYDFDVVMTCTGCSGAIDRVLKKNIVEREYFFMAFICYTEVTR
jgi:hypothetical protein